MTKTSFIFVGIAIVVATCVCLFLINPQNEEVRPDGENAPLTKTTVIPAAPTPPASTPHKLPRAHKVEEVTHNHVVLIAQKDTTPSVLQHVQAALNVEVKKSASGRTGSEIHFPAGVSLHAAQQQLSNEGVTLAGQLKRFHFNSAHNHKTCGTCLVHNFEALSQAPGVKQIASFLGDAERSRIDVLVQEDLADSNALLSILEQDHFPNY